MINTKLQYGSHFARKEGMCAMEFAAYLASEPHSAEPKCVCRIIAEFMIAWNDAYSRHANGTRAREHWIKPLICETLFTKGKKTMRDQRLRLVKAFAEKHTRNVGAFLHHTKTKEIDTYIVAKFFARKYPREAQQLVRDMCAVGQTAERAMRVEQCKLQNQTLLEGVTT